jgi:hypothetical protein
MNNKEIITALDILVNSFKTIGIEYYIGGSVASSAYGIARATLDIDLIADIKDQNVEPLINSLQNIFYIDEDMIVEAIKHKSSFNIIHLDTMLKIDIFILKDTEYDRNSFNRKKIDTLTEDSAQYFLCSAEDIILNKMLWFLSSDKLSDRQWKDIIGILKTRGNELDIEYLQKWAKELKITDLVEKALKDSEKP